MARLIGPDEGSRQVSTIDPGSKTLRSKAGRPAVFYTDSAATQLADVLTYPAGAAIAGSSTTIDTNSMLPLIQFPNGVDTLWVVVDGGPAWPVYARTDDRLDGIATTVTALDATVTALDVRVTAVEEDSGGGDADPAQYTQVWTFAGDIETGTGKMRFYNRTGREVLLAGAWVAADTAPDGAAVIVDVNLNGTTVYTTQANRPRLPDSLNAGPLSDEPDVTVVEGGDYLTVDVDQVGDDVAGADLTVGVVYSLGDESIPPPIGVTRHNVALNPALKNAITGWTGANGTSDLVRVTGLSGFPRTTGALYSSGGFAQSPTGVATPGTVYTASLYIATTVAVSPSGGVLFLAFTRSAGGTDFSHSVNVGTIPAQTVTRISIENITAPANTTGAYIVLDGINFGFVACDITALLIEPSPAVGAYFDGDSPGASWDGADGDSASTV